MKNILTLSFFIVCMTTQVLFGQTKAIQPTIMVVPFAREGMSIRAAYELNEESRIAITKAKEAFDKRSVNTIDLVAKLKQANNNAVLTDGQASDVKDDVIAMSGADIYVVIEASKNYSSTGNSANVIMTAYDAFSGESLANKTGNSPKILTDNFEKLTEKAIEGQIDNLLNTIQEKFTLILENGRTLFVTVGIEEGASLSFDDEIGDDLLSDLVESWVEQNAFKGQYHIQGTTSNKQIYDQVKVPVFDEAGKNYKISKFTSEFRKFFKSKNITAKQIIQGNNIIFTLSN